MEKTDQRWFSPSRLWVPYVAMLFVYGLATFLTDAYFMGDTWIYVDDILKAKRFNATFWDFGHPLWRPLGWLVAQCFYSLRGLGIATDRWSAVTLALLDINWVAGLISVFLVHNLASRFCKRRWVVYLITFAFLFSNAILNYTQTGQPYLPGVSLILLGLYLLVRDGERPTHSWRTAVFAGAALAFGACFWLPLLLSVFAILLCPLVLFGFNKPRLRLAVQTCLVCALIGGLVYAGTFFHLGIHDSAGLKAWIGSSAHGVIPDSPLRAIQRMVFALARNFLNMGNDGRLFKRYIVHDDFNPVSLYDLVRFSLWKVALFYIFLSAVLFKLVFSRLGKRTLALLLINALPVLLFAVFLFESGSIDRYLPLFPMLLVALSVSLGGEDLRSWTGFVALLFLAVVIVSNVGAMSKEVLEREQEKVATRIRDLQPLLKPESRVVTVNQQDELYAFNQNFPFNPINRSGHLDADILVDPGTTQISRWQKIFASKTLSMWEQRGDVWISKRILYQRPRMDWNWVEGDDPHISWTDIHSFFSSIEMGQSVGGEDGFLLVLPSPKNKQSLTSTAHME